MKYLRPTNNPTQHSIVNHDQLNMFVLVVPSKQTTHRCTFLGVSCVLNLSCTFGGPQTHTTRHKALYHYSSVPSLEETKQNIF